MDNGLLETYLADLARELHSRWIWPSRILEEVRSHLLEAVEQGQRNGLTTEEAQRQALARFGPARGLAVQFAAERNLMLQKVLYTIGLILGLTIAYVDTRPTWDDTGITAAALLASAGLLGLLAPKRPWLWALVVGIWLPLANIIANHNFTALIALIFPFVGAYIGFGVRKAITAATTA